MHTLSPQQQMPQHLCPLAEHTWAAGGGGNDRRAPICRQSHNAVESWCCPAGPQQGGVHGAWRHAAATAAIINAGENEQAGWGRWRRGRWHVRWGRRHGWWCAWRWRQRWRRGGRLRAQRPQQGVDHGIVCIHHPHFCTGNKLQFGMPHFTLWREANRRTQGSRQEPRPPAAPDLPSCHRECSQQRTALNRNTPGVHQAVEENVRLLERQDQQCRHVKQPELPGWPS